MADGVSYIVVHGAKRTHCKQRTDEIGQYRIVTDIYFSEGPLEVQTCRVYILLASSSNEPKVIHFER